MKRSIAILLMALMAPLAALAAPTALEQSTASLLAAGMEKGALERLNQSLAERNYGEEQSLRVHAVIQNTLKAGLPAQPVALKAQEGLSKNVEPARLVAAMQRVQARYGFAYAQARSLGADAKVGNTLAESLAAGLNERDCERLTAQLRDRSRDRLRDQDYLNETCQTIRELARQGVASGTISRVMGEAINKGYTAREMAQLRAAFKKEAGWSSPESVARAYAGAIAGGSRGGQLGSRSGSGAGGGMGGNAGGSGGGANGSGSGSGGSGGSGGHGGGGRR